jgi:hypothetical protein
MEEQTNECHHTQCKCVPPPPNSLETERDSCDEDKVCDVPVASTSKGIVKEKKGGGRDYTKQLDPDFIQIVGMEWPQVVPEGKGTRKYRIRVKFRYGFETRVRTRTISFGKRGVPDYFETGDVNVKMKVRSSCKSYDNPLKPNFYRINLLNSDARHSPELPLTECLGLAWLKLREKLKV